MASNSHKRAKGNFPSGSPSNSLTPPTVPRSLSNTPPPSPSPFMRSFHASGPPRTNTPSHTSSTSRWLNRPYTTIQGIWFSHRHFRRFFLSFVCVVLPTFLTAAYFAGVYRGGVDAPISGFTSIGAGNEVTQWHDQGPNQGLLLRQGQGLGHLNSGLKRRWTDDGIVPRQVSSSVDDADTPVLSLGGLGSTNTRASSSPSSSSSTAGTEFASGSLSATPTTTLPATAAPSIPSSPILPTPFVQPFDTTLSTDFLTASCQTYFANLTQSLSFRQCRPFSLLLSTSQGFLSAQTNLTLLTSIIYGTCTTTPTEDECVNRMDSLANDLKSACSEELNDGHAFTWDALNGMKNYKMMRDAACLRNQRTNSYCFVDAVVTTPPSDIYFYQLPLGTPLPGTTITSASGPTSTSANSSTSSPSAAAAKFARRRVDWSNGTGTLGGELNALGITVIPTCSACTQSLMGIYAGYATNSSLLISQTYGSAQRSVDSTCGSGYASAVSAAGVTRPLPFTLLGIFSLSRLMYGVAIAFVVATVGGVGIGL